MSHHNHGGHSTTGHAYAHHFESAEHEFESSKFGVWLFLVTEVMMFGGLFVGYAIFKNLFPEAFHEGHMHLDRVMGALNTVVLICSSLSMALAVGMAQRNERQKSARFLLFTILCACIFMVVKYFEYKHKFHDGLLPAGLFSNHHAVNAKMPLFFSFYFMMTGLHGIHVLIGIGMLLWLLKRTKNNEFSSEYFTPVEMVGLYWHFVDLVWIYLFPLLYLVG